MVGSEFLELRLILRTLFDGYRTARMEAEIAGRRFKPALSQVTLGESSREGQCLFP
jgi:hypothetical protein